MRGALSWLQFIAAIKCHDQGQLPGEVVYWVLKVSEGKPMTIMAGHMAAGRSSPGAVAESLHPICKQESERAIWGWDGLWKPKSPTPWTHLLQQDLLICLKQFHQQRAKHSNI